METPADSGAARTGPIVSELTPPGSAVKVMRAETTDFSTLKPVRVQLWRQDRTLLESGPPHIRLTHVIVGPSTSVGREVSQGSQHIRLEALADMISVTFQRGLTGRCRVDGSEVDELQPVVMTQGGKLDCVAPGGLYHHQVKFLPETFESISWADEGRHEHLETLPSGFDRAFASTQDAVETIQRWHALGMVVLPVNAEARGLYRLCVELCDLENDPQLCMHAPAVYWADQLAWYTGQLLAAAAPRSQPRAPGRASLRRMAALAMEEYVRSHCERPVSMVELSRHIGVSIRTLHTSSVEQFGVTVGDYCRAFRLAQVRRALLSPRAGETVRSAATRFGFLQLGRFAAQYRRLFGERPSETLERAVGRERPPAA